MLVTGTEELETTRLSGEQQTYLRVISRNASRLLAMVNNLLKLAELTHDIVLESDGVTGTLARVVLPPDDEAGVIPTDGLSAVDA
jgi:signal transduction histidine kinase